MSDSDLAYCSAAEVASRIKAKTLSATEVTRAALARAERAQAALNCFITICAEEALRDAKAADAALARGDDVGPLHGVPLHVKDLVATKGVRTTFASHIYEHNVPEQDAVCIARLKKAGAILIGKT
ncbi:MAG: amidase family protein, partial [Hyphomicrobiaceae bacterium]